jgi:hypothetical protein
VHALTVQAPLTRHSNYHKPGARNSGLRVHNYLFNQKTDKDKLLENSTIPLVNMNHGARIVKLFEFNRYATNA